MTPFVIDVTPFVTFRHPFRLSSLRLGRYFKMSPQFWLNLQAHYDLEEAEDRIGDKLDSEVRILAVA